MTKCPLDTGLFDRNTHTRGAARNFSKTFSKSKFPKDKIPKLDQSHLKWIKIVPWWDLRMSSIDQSELLFTTILWWQSSSIDQSELLFTILPWWQSSSIEQKFTLINWGWLSSWDCFEQTKVHFDQFVFCFFYHHGIILNKSSLWSIRRWLSSLDGCEHKFTLIN